MFEVEQTNTSLEFQEMNVIKIRSEFNMDKQIRAGNQWYQNKNWVEFLKMDSQYK